MSTNSPRSLNTLSPLAAAENRITVRDACTETAHGHDAGASPLLHRAIKSTCKALGCRASALVVDCDLEVTLADGTVVKLNWDSGIDGYDYAESTADAELLQAAEDAAAAPVAPSPVEILRCAIVRATCELATWSAANKTNTTTLECRAEFFRINGMIDCLRLLGGSVAIVGFSLTVKRAYESAIPNCINIDALRVCTPR